MRDKIYEALDRCDSNGKLDHQNLSENSFHHMSKVQSSCHAGYARQADTWQIVGRPCLYQHGGFVNAAIARAFLRAASKLAGTYFAQN